MRCWTKPRPAEMVSHVSPMGAMRLSAYPLARYDSVSLGLKVPADISRLRHKQARRSIQSRYQFRRRAIPLLLVRLACRPRTSGAASRGEYGSLNRRVSLGLEGWWDVTDDQFDTPYIEDYLRLASLEDEKRDLLWKFYARREDYLPAAKALHDLATRSR